MADVKTRMTELLSENRFYKSKDGLPGIHYVAGAILNELEHEGGVDALTRLLDDMALEFAQAISHLSRDDKYDWVDPKIVSALELLPGYFKATAKKIKSVRK